MTLISAGLAAEADKLKRFLTPGKISAQEAEALRQRAIFLRRRHYGNSVYLRGLIEFTNCCKNDCYYCGIRSSAKTARYRLTSEEILDCCCAGYDAGLRTFVLQGGEDPYWNDLRLCRLVDKIKTAFSGCAVTLSVGERSRDSYRALFDAGADRYLLRHESASPSHYANLHPPQMNLKTRMDCLYNLKEIGYQTGCGFMVGTPGQTPDDLLADLAFIEEFQPEMVGIGPFIPAKDTPFSCEPAGSFELTLTLLSLVRNFLPKALLPATTALGTIAADGLSAGLWAGANVIMPNLSPQKAREKYRLYDNKANACVNIADAIGELKSAATAIGFAVTESRGDHADFRRKE